MILQYWLDADYQLYNYFVSKLNVQLKEIGKDKLKEELKTLEKMNKILKEKCKIQLVDNTNKDGTNLHMTSDMVKAYDLRKECALYATSEPSFYNIIRKEQEKGPLK